MEDQWIVLVGHALDEMAAVGPFPSKDDATEYGNMNYGDEVDWGVFEMTAP